MLTCGGIFSQRTFHTVATVSIEHLARTKIVPIYISISQRKPCLNPGDGSHSHVAGRTSVAGTPSLVAGVGQWRAALELGQNFLNRQTRRARDASCPLVFRQLVLILRSIQHDGPRSAHAIDRRGAASRSRKCPRAVSSRRVGRVQGQEVRHAGSVGAYLRAGMAPDRGALQAQLFEFGASSVSISQLPCAVKVPNRFSQVSHHQEATRCLRLRSRLEGHGRLHLRRRDRSPNACNQGCP